MDGGDESKQPSPSDPSSPASPTTNPPPNTADAAYAAATGNPVELDASLPLSTSPKSPFARDSVSVNSNWVELTPKDKAVVWMDESFEEKPAGKPAQEVRTLLSGGKLALLMIGLALCIFLAALDQTIVSTATPKIASDFKSFQNYAWVSAAYLLTSTAFQALYGRFSDIVGRKATMLFGILVFELGSMLAGISKSMIMLIISRAIQGVGGGGLIAMVTIVIADVVNMRDRGKFQGIFGAMFGLASVVGPLLGGAFTDKSTWRWCFFINLPFGAIAVFTIVMFLNVPQQGGGDTKEKLKRIDYFGILTILPGVVAILLAVLWGGSTYPWDGSVIVSLFIVGGALLIAFVLIEIYVAKEPLLPMFLFRTRNFTLGVMIAFFVGFCMMATLIYLPVYFQFVNGDSATSSGLRMLPTLIGLVLCSLASGIAISKKAGLYLVFPRIGTAIMTLGMGMLSLLDQHSSFGVQVGVQIPVGIGIGLCLQAMVLTVQACLKPQHIAVGTSALLFFRAMGFVAGVAVFGALLNNKVASYIAASPLGSMGGGGSVFSESQGVDLDVLRSLPPEIQAIIIEAFVKAIDFMFLVAIPFGGMSFILCIFLQNIPLSKTMTSAPAE